MTVTTDTLPYDQIGQDDVIIVRLPEAHLFVAAMRARLGDKGHILPMDPTTDVLCISEAVMREAGWVRAS